jgi:hypothetical protein
MDRPTYTFKIGQQVFYYAGGRGTRKKKTGPFTVVALIRQSNGVTMYRIKSRTHEHRALADELRLVLPKAKLSRE